MKKTTLKVTAPSWCTSFKAPTEGGDTLVIDRVGVEVDAKTARTLIQTAALYGATITEVSE